MEKKCKVRRYVVDHFRSVYLLSKRTHEGKIALKTQSNINMTIYTSNFTIIVLRSILHTS